MFGFLKKIFGTAQDRLLRKYFKIVKEINEWEQKFLSLSDEELRGKTDEFRNRIRQGETSDQILPEAYAVVKVVCRRLCGTEVHVSGYDQKWDMVPYDVQLVGAIAMHYGAIAEMQTGEGKTLTAILPLYLNALTGKPVHLVTVNDYLAERDCQWVGSILRWMGLTTGALTNDVPIEGRKEIYQKDVVYGTASEFGFDYLRDNSMAHHKDQQVQRGHYFAIVDEIDSILIDEARTPLIISGPVPVSRQLYGELKGGVAGLVRLQRDYCNKLANEARKILEKRMLEEEQGIIQPKLSKQEEEIQREAFRKLWLVGKGTPQNKFLRRAKENPDMRAAIDKWDLYYYADQNKEEKLRVLADLYFVIDEKGNEFELTDKGIKAWEECTNGTGHADDFVMIDMGYEFSKIDSDSSLDSKEKMDRKLAIQEEDSQRKERAHNIRQLLRAHLLMEKDVDYIIQDSKIVIIDENTGRPQPGRRFSDGLHQAIEAKEGVEIQKETQTYATITLQNYFRMYDKLCGMTGTAITEANEFKEIYKLEVLEIPTHKKGQRKDAHDEIYMSEREKYSAILAEVRKIHSEERPILIGTESVEISEKLSRIFKQNGLEHVVLNAKQNEKEAEIIAHAGRKGAITISTNMAGRGTDIKLEPGVAKIGGLHVLGTTRHQSRRIDRQLRGRCARQGDPGTSKFFISFEDSLLRLFASQRLNAILLRFRPPEGEPISAPILNRSIETAQKRVEQRNYMIRKHTLEYDDVMNKQRQEIYSFRNDVLHSTDMLPICEEIIEDVCIYQSEKFLEGRGTHWDPEGYRQWLIQHYPVSFEEHFFDDDFSSADELTQKAAERLIASFKEKLQREDEKFLQFQKVEQPFRPTNEVMRNIILRRLDKLWQEHLLQMDHLRSDVSLRSVGQRDPLLEFKHEAFNLFEDLYKNMRTEIAQDLFRFEMVSPARRLLEEVIPEGIKLETSRSLVNEMEHPSQHPPINGSAVDGKSEEEIEKSQPILVGPKVGRNDACPCGSGKKYKKCCGVGIEES